MQEGKTRFGARMNLRLTEPLADAIKRAADKRVQTYADYVRTATVERLGADGIEIERGAA
ncbi:hypothetical protein [Bradyrhizobium arachidis]|uniref:Uncharacterized protein n=1 Tax=Bradyrhizobium arachidis TaxID=858423 RepID=A0AAE7NJQ5_9BRAD|nr:hypothetical protein [Bradyrhizobium arachidis]QOZ67154.1 hypothetical protein WN72_13140 [Bradyrhizobium arachidis]SFV16016.1 hypothetical protein SAMN05192541_124116 [Bradyrhizobium arachidis]